MEVTNPQRRDVGWTFEVPVIPPTAGLPICYYGPDGYEIKARVHSVGYDSWRNRREVGQQMMLNVAIPRFLRPPRIIIGVPYDHLGTANTWRWAPEFGQYGGRSRL